VTWPRAALFSLSDKSGAVEFARALAAHGSRIVASGGTAQHLRQAGLEVTAVEEWTGFPELLGGRVKTLHPHVHGPILARRSEPGDLAALAERGVEPIDLVAVTLYPFEQKAATLDEAGAVEEIDIGGVALLRAAAKNFKDVIVIHDPAQYPEVLRALESGVTADQRRSWAMQTFARTARMTRRSAPSSHVASRLGTRLRSKWWRSSVFARCATGRIRISRRRSIAAWASAAPFMQNVKGKSFPTTISSISIRPSGWPGSSRTRPA